MSFYTPVPTLAPDERDHPAQGPRVWAGGIFLASSFGFLFLAGCFTIGILSILDPGSLNGVQPGTTHELTQDQQMFLLTLYVLVALSVLASAVLFLIGVFGLARVLYAKGEQGK